MDLELSELVDLVAFCLWAVMSAGSISNHCNDVLHFGGAEVDPVLR